MYHLNVISKNNKITTVFHTLKAAESKLQSIVSTWNANPQYFKYKSPTSGEYIFREIACIVHQDKIIVAQEPS